MTETSEQRMQALTDSFVARLRRGESPSIQSYKDRHPDLADEIEDVFPALEMLEQCRPVLSSAHPRLAAVFARLPADVRRRLLLITEHTVEAG